VLTGPEKEDMAVCFPEHSSFHLSGEVYLKAEKEEITLKQGAIEHQPGFHSPTTRNFWLGRVCVRIASVSIKYNTGVKVFENPINILTYLMKAN
jgi:hypothetical protein